MAGGHLVRNQSFGVKFELRHGRPPVSESIHSFIQAFIHSYVHLVNLSWVWPGPRPALDQKILQGTE